MCLLSSDWPKFWNLYKSFLLYKNIPTLILKFWKKKKFLFRNLKNFDIPYRTGCLIKILKQFFYLFFSHVCVLLMQIQTLCIHLLFWIALVATRKSIIHVEVEGKQMIFAVGFCFGQRWKQSLSKFAGIEYNHYQIPFMGNWSSKKQRYDM